MSLWSSWQLKKGKYIYGNIVNTNGNVTEETLRLNVKNSQFP